MNHDARMKAMEDVFRKAGTGAEQRINEWRKPEPDVRAHERTKVWDKDPLVIRGVEYFKIGDFAAAIGRKQNTIRSWEAKGYLPPARYRTPKPVIAKLPGKTPAGKRLWTRAQIEAVLEAAEATGVLNVEYAAKANWKLFAKMVRDSWAAL